MKNELQGLADFLKYSGASEESREVLAASVSMEQEPITKKDPYAEELGKSKELKESIDTMKEHNLERVRLFGELTELASKLEAYGYKVVVEPINSQPDKAENADIASMMGVANLDVVLQKLADIADDLDNSGLAKEASIVDEFIVKHAEDVVKWKKEDKNSDQSKRYDSEFHRSLQVREPKDPDVNNLEGGKEHHVKTYSADNTVGLNTRHCPEHIGVSLGRVAENTYQCALDGKVYNWETGWKDYQGNQHSGSSVAAQTPEVADYAISHRLFDSRNR